jgi:hypothetical protein
MCDAIREDVDRILRESGNTDWCGMCISSTVASLAKAAPAETLLEWAFGKAQAEAITSLQNEGIKLRDDLINAKSEARQQRERADRAESRLAALTGDAAAIRFLELRKELPYHIGGFGSAQIASVRNALEALVKE